jgi:hypothetical protein
VPQRSWSRILAANGIALLPLRGVHVAGVGEILLWWPLLCRADSRLRREEGRGWAAALVALAAVGCSGGRRFPADGGEAIRGRK